MGGIRAEVVVDAAEACPAARVSSETGASTYSISKSTFPGPADTVTEEFMIDGSVDVDDEFTEVFNYGTKSVFRFSREAGTMCPCECVELHESPVIEARTREGRLHVAFHAKDMETLRTVVLELSDRYPGVDVKRLVRSTSPDEKNDLVFVDRGRLTDRQLEVLETAHEAGYFDHPKRANAGEVATQLGITTSTFTEHLSAAQSKLLATIIDH